MLAGRTLHPHQARRSKGRYHRSFGSRYRSSERPQEQMRPSVLRERPKAIRHIAENSALNVSIPLSLA
ncbi:hypothetical protein ACP46_gp42 [Rhizobium phage RHEph06]|uniref:Uncharacterized protein n=2 Tax=Kleczkowskavirus RHEph4 TaxID=1921526 RepID=L7TMG2_9CAUD|nr:hypothetical protein ACP46_gp42 [Rhizobium phage RHEph06]YP_009598483.1 hypothetical protein FDH25_gp41 [Rhizobium phage RHEph04]AGC35727.1 hypothetical protein RHEph04_gp041 [Rhizobium phage RHEph04]AGC35803.1 hypothetical protein RHEph05_gp036 [Rhizobium phage RHEph05]AGC35884.1 hypothetical protein RHEph06_gp042 [Rhizobium phage RHEph06]